MSLTTVPTPGEFSTFVRVPTGVDHIKHHGLNEKLLKTVCLGETTGDVICLMHQMMLAMGQVFGDGFLEVKGITRDAISQYLNLTDSHCLAAEPSSASWEGDGKNHVTKIDNVRLYSRNNIVRAGIPKVLIYVVPYVGETPVVYADDKSPPCIGAIAHNFPGTPRAMVGSTAVSSDELLTPLSPQFTAKALEPDEKIPSRIKKPIEIEAIFKQGTRVVAPMPVLNTEKLLHPDSPDVELLREGIRQKVSGVEFYFTRFLKNKKTG